MILEFVKRSTTIMILFGILAVLWGILLTANPGISAATLAIFWGAFALVDGIMTLVVAFQNKEGRGWNILSGVLGILAGLIVMANPGTGLVVAGWVFGLWLIFRGVLQIALLGAGLTGWHKFFNIFGGILWVIAGVLAIVFPLTAAIASVWIIGILAIFWGVQLVFTAIALQRTAKDIKATVEDRVAEAAAAAKAAVPAAPAAGEQA